MKSSEQDGGNGNRERSAVERLRERFEIVYQEVGLGKVNITLPELADPVAYLESRVNGNGGNGKVDLPYWTKLWPAALALAQYAASLPVKPGGRMLELGAGMALPGLAAAAAGHQVVLSDLDPVALQIAAAGVEINRLEEKAAVRAVNWKEPPNGLGRFETILGAEILYEPSLYLSLIEFLDQVLAPGGTIFISHEARPFEIAFFELARDSFILRRATRTMNVDGEETRIFLYALTRKEES